MVSKIKKLDNVIIKGIRIAEMPRRRGMFTYNNSFVTKVIALIVVSAFCFTQTGVTLAGPIYKEAPQNLRQLDIAEGNGTGLAGLAEALQVGPAGNRGVVFKGGQTGTDAAAAGNVTGVEIREKFNSLYLGNEGDSLGVRSANMEAVGNLLLLAYAAKVRKQVGSSYTLLFSDKESIVAGPTLTAERHWLSQVGDILKGTKTGPKNFWNWLASGAEDGEARRFLTELVEEGYKLVKHPNDTEMMQLKGAYLAVIDQVFPAAAQPAGDAGAAGMLTREDRQEIRRVLTAIKPHYGADVLSIRNSIDVLIDQLDAGIDLPYTEIYMSLDGLMHRVADIVEADKNFQHKGDVFELGQLKGKLIESQRAIRAVAQPAGAGRVILDELEVNDRYANPSLGLPGEIGLNGLLNLANLYEHIIGFTTYSGKGVSAEQVRSVKEFLEAIIRAFPIEDSLVVSGLTDVGGVKLVYDVADDLNYKRAGIVAGIALSPGENQPIRRVDHTYIEEEREGNSYPPPDYKETPVAGGWGSESIHFLNLIQQARRGILVAFGGGGQAKDEINAAVTSGKPVILITGVKDRKGNSGAVDSLVEENPDLANNSNVLILDINSSVDPAEISAFAGVAARATGAAAGAQEELAGILQAIPESVRDSNPRVWVLSDGQVLYREPKRGAKLVTLDIPAGQVAAIAGALKTTGSDQITFAAELLQGPYFAGLANLIADLASRGIKPGERIVSGNVSAGMTEDDATRTKRINVETAIYGALAEITKMVPRDARVWVLDNGQVLYREPKRGAKLVTLDIPAGQVAAIAGALKTTGSDQITFAAELLQGPYFAGLANLISDLISRGIKPGERIVLGKLTASMSDSSGTRRIAVEAAARAEGERDALPLASLPQGARIAAAAQQPVTGQAVGKTVLVITDNREFSIDVKNIEAGKNVEVISVDLSEHLSGVGSLRDSDIIKAAISKASEDYKPDEVYTYFTNPATVNLLSAIKGTAVDLRDISDKRYQEALEALAYLTAV